MCRVKALEVKDKIFVEVGVETDDIGVESGDNGMEVKRQGESSPSEIGAWLETLERNLEKIMEVVSSLGKSMDSLGGGAHMGIKGGARSGAR